jgi:hypothetical protein
LGLACVLVIDRLDCSTGVKAVANRLSTFSAVKADTARISERALLPYFIVSVSDPKLFGSAELLATVCLWFKSVFFSD